MDLSEAKQTVHPACVPSWASGCNSQTSEQVAPSPKWGPTKEGIKNSAVQVSFLSKKSILGEPMWEVEQSRGPGCEGVRGGRTVFGDVSQ